MLTSFFTQAEALRQIAIDSRKEAKTHTEIYDSYYSLVYNKHFVQVYSAIHAEAILGGTRAIFTIEYNSDVHRKIADNLKGYLVEQGFQVYFVGTESHVNLLISW